MNMKLHKESHVDHGLSGAQLAHVLLAFDGRDAFFKETITLPESLGTVPCGLYGPIMGDPPIADVDTIREKRGERAYKSRMLRSGRLGYDIIQGTTRRTNTLTVIGGPHDGNPCILYTVFGGPSAPQEPGDPNCKDIEGSASFWSEHALTK
jgi:hypothetical protein